MRLLLLPICAVLALTACGGGPRPSRLTVHVGIHTYDAKAHKPVERMWTLRCKPTGGDMPLAARLCADIARHPVAMLAPGRARSVCGGSIDGPVVSVSSKRGGFSGEPGCNWPGGAALEVYWAATQGDRHVLDLVEPRLRCDESPLLLAKPTPWSSVVACVHGRWTPRTEQAIRLAASTPAIAGLRTRFPHDVGTLPCRIVGGGLGLHTFHGRCGVNVTHLWGTPQVTFTERWAQRAKHTWVVTIVDGKPRLAHQSGSVPPQYVV